MKLRIALSAILFSIAGTAAKADTLNSRLWVDGKVVGTDGAVAQVTTPSKLEFEFRDADTGGIAHHFHVMHGKPMHLIVVSEDLSHFAHVHPTERPHTAKAFHLTANTPTVDPDNFAVPNLLPFGGRYFLFGEVMPMGYGMLNFPYDLNVAGPTRAPAAAPIDELDKDGKILKYFSDDGLPSDEASGVYLIKLEVLPMEHCQVVIPRLHFELLIKKSGEYIQVNDLEPWLESYGHAILIGRGGNVAADKAMLHLHSVWPLPTGDISKDERGPFVELATHSHGKSMQSDHYRAWIQLQHKGKVRTFSFDVEWKLEQAKLKAIRSPLLCLQ